MPTNDIIDGIFSHSMIRKTLPQLNYGDFPVSMTSVFLYYSTLQIW